MLLIVLLLIYIILCFVQVKKKFSESLFVAKLLLKIALTILCVRRCFFAPSIEAKCTVYDGLTLSLSKQRIHTLRSESTAHGKISLNNNRFVALGLGGEPDVLNIPV